MPSCLCEHMNYQERKRWLTLDFVKWRESQDESQTCSLTNGCVDVCVCLYRGGSFHSKIPAFLLSFRLALTFLLLFLLDILVQYIGFS